LLAQWSLDWQTMQVRAAVVDGGSDQQASASDRCTFARLSNLIGVPYSEPNSRVWAGRTEEAGVSIDRAIAGVATVTATRRVNLFVLDSSISAPEHSEEAADFCDSFHFGTADEADCKTR
jgi:hypothetical protein